MGLRSHRRDSIEQRMAHALERPALTEPPAPRIPRGTNPTVVELLEFERAHPEPTDRKGAAIRAAFDITPARYVQLLRYALDTTDALKHDALLTRQIRDRIRDRANRRAASLGQTTREHP